MSFGHRPANVEQGLGDRPRRRSNWTWAAMRHRRRARGGWWVGTLRVCPARPTCSHRPHGVPTGMQPMRPGPSGYHRDGGHGGNAVAGGTTGGNVGRHEKSKKLEYAFFSGSSPKFLDAITKMLEKQSFEKQDYLFKEGDVGFNMYFISSGSVILCSSSDLREVQVLSRGSHCGDLALLGTSKRLSNAIAREHTECLVLRTGGRGREWQGTLGVGVGGWDGGWGLGIGWDWELVKKGSSLGP
eukprot:s215_g10.t3